MVDQATGEIWCFWIENGEWVKVKGECDTASQPSTQPVSQPPAEQLPPEQLPPEQLPPEQPSEEPAFESQPQ